MEMPVHGKEVYRLFKLGGICDQEDGQAPEGREMGRQGGKNLN